MDTYIVAGASLEVLGSAARKPVGLAHRSARDSIMPQRALGAEEPERKQRLRRFDQQLPLEQMPLDL
eukprot:COSAG06_NODE_29878_length_549_cov_0.624444_2_plen_67_part_00